MASALEGRRQPERDDLAGERGCDDASPQREDVRIVTPDGALVRGIGIFFDPGEQVPGIVLVLVSVVAIGGFNALVSGRNRVDEALGD